MQPRGALRDEAGVVPAARVAQAPHQSLLREGELRAEAVAERSEAQLLAQGMPLAVATLDDLVGLEAEVEVEGEGEVEVEMEVEVEVGSRGGGWQGG